MDTKCCICEKEMYIDMDEYLELDMSAPEDQQLFCDECAVAARVWISENELRKN